MGYVFFDTSATTAFAPNMTVTPAGQLPVPQPARDAIRIANARTPITLMMNKTISN
jgi:hypothetical protein